MDFGNQYGTLEVQKRCLELIKSFDSFATANGIQYSLAYGTLLGAVRHQGFIPWDDDLDIFIDRINYNKLVQCIVNDDNLVIEYACDNSLWVDRIRLKTDCVCRNRATMDVFFLDNVPNSKVARALKILLIYMLQGMMKKELSIKKGSILMKVCSVVTYLLGMPLSQKQKFKWYQKVSTIGNNRVSNCVSCYNTVFSEIKIMFPNNIMKDYQRLEFEGLNLSVMSGFREFLATNYGDYMTPPKKEDRIPQHIRLNTEEI